jgi:hypothetical protein
LLVCVEARNSCDGAAKNKTRYQNIPSRYQIRATAQHEAPSDLVFAPLGVPRCLLGNVIAIFDVDIGAFRLVGRLELELFIWNLKN